MKFRYKSSIVIFYTLLLAIRLAIACDVPVFRFALERWSPDDYKVEIFGSYSEQEQDELRQSLEHTNTIVAFSASEKPRLELHTPGEDSKKIFIHDDPKEAVSRIANSPTRQAIIDRILSGASGVFILVKSGEHEEDNRALGEINKAIQHAIQHAEKNLKILSGVVQADSDEKDLRDPDNNLNSSLELKIDFEVIVIDRSDDEILTQMLLAVEDDLLDVKSTMVFTIFGRGRVLPPFIGKGINYGNLMVSLREITAACSCTIKAQNPGSDIILKADWSTRLKGSEVIIDKELPPLSGPGDFHSSRTNAKENIEPLAGEVLSHPKESNLPLHWVFMGIGAAIVAFIFLGTLVIRLKR